MLAGALRFSVPPVTPSLREAVVATVPVTSRCRLAGCPARRRPKPPSPGRVRSSAGGGPGPTVRSAVGRPRWRWSLAGKEHARSLLRAINHASEAHGEAGPDSSRICREGGRRRAQGRWSALPALTWSRRGRPRASGGRSVQARLPMLHPGAPSTLGARCSVGLLGRATRSGCADRGSPWRHPAVSGGLLGDRWCTLYGPGDSGQGQRAPQHRRSSCAQPLCGPHPPSRSVLGPSTCSARVEVRGPPWG